MDSDWHEINCIDLLYCARVMFVCGDVIHVVPLWIGAVESRA
jgi:hypothetical protein